MLRYGTSYCNKVIQKKFQVLADLGMIPVEDTVTKIKSSTYNVLLDGKVLGFVPYKDAPRVVDKLRMLKIKKEETR